MSGASARLSILDACSSFDHYQSYFEDTSILVLCSPLAFAYRTVSRPAAFRAGIFAGYAIVTAVTVALRALASAMTSFAFAHQN